jgi:magnesium transporter
MAEMNLVQTRVDAIRRLVRRKATQPLTRALTKSSAADIAEALAHLTRNECLFLAKHMPDTIAGETLLTCNEETMRVLIEGVAFERLTKWLDEMEPDDQADLIERLPDELQRRLLERMLPNDRQNVEELMAYAQDSAGGIMSPVAFRLNDATTCREAISALQEQGDVEMVFYLYVENDAGQLVGVTSLRQLLMNSPSTALAEIMTSDVIAVSAETDQEEVARIAQRYSFLAIPVVDDTRKLLGIVTVDDVLDVVREEAAEDMLKMAGVPEDSSNDTDGALTAARKRLTWLLVTLVGGVGLSEVIGLFEETLSREAVLAGFIPLVMGLGGNVGIQAATLTVRGLAVGGMAYDRASSVRLLFKEGQVGLVMGVALAVLLAGYCLIRYPNWELAAAVGLSIVLAVLTSAVLGTLIPMSLDKVGVDPAVATGPFVTTSIDWIAIVVYFVVCTRLFGF